MQLKDQKIIVTGGARGIGAAAVAAFVAEGAKVASLDILDDLGAKFAAKANEQGPGSAIYLNCDISKRASVQAAFKQSVDRLGGLDSLVNCAAIERHARPEAIDENEWDLLIDINVKGTYLTNHAAYSYMKQTGGTILNFGSDAGLMAYPRAAHYSASKGAVMAWTRSVANVWGADNVRVNSVVPAIWTPMYDEHRAHLSPEELAAHDAQMAAIIPLGGKLGDPEEDLAPVLVFLVSPAAKFITGQIISVNGGANSVR